MTDRLKLSIAMAVYNGERFIGEQFESYLAQTRHPDELVVSDNASTDRTREIVQEFAARAPFKVKLKINECNLGVAKNFERAISSCTGDIVFLSDCDDVWLPHKLRRMEQVFMAESSVGIVISNSLHVDSDLKPLGITELREAPRSLRRELGYHVLNPGFEAGRYLLKNLSCAGHNLAFRSSNSALFLPFPDALGAIRMGGHDLFIGGTLFSFSKVGVIGEPLTLYRRHPEQATTGIILGLSGRFWKLLDPWSRETLLAHLEIRELVYARNLANGLKDENVLGLLQSRNSYDRNRVRLWERPRWSRLPRVVKDLLMGRYHRFSNGLSTAVKDLLVRRCTNAPGLARYHFAMGHAEPQKDSNGNC